MSQQEPRRLSVVGKPPSQGVSRWAEVSRLLREGELDRAEHELEIARKTEPNPVGEALVRARIIWERGSRNEAVAGLRRAARQHSSVALHAALAEMYLLLNRPELALEWATSAKKLSPTPATEDLLMRVSAELFERLYEGEEPEQERFGTELTVFAADPWADDGSSTLASVPPPPGKVMPVALGVKEPSFSDATPTANDADVSRMLAALPAATSEPSISSRTAVMRPTRRALLEARQMEALLGGSLFASGPRREKTKLTRYKHVDFTSLLPRITIVVFLVSFVLGAASLTTFGLQRKARVEAETLAQDLRSLLEIGSFDHADPLIDRLDDAADTSGRNEDYEDLIAFAHILLHYFHDEDAARILRARGVFDHPRGTPGLERLLGRALIQLETGESPNLAELERIAQMEKDEPHAPIILGIAASKAGKLKLAKRAFEQAEAIAPTNLAYLYAQVDHFAGLQKNFEAGEVVSRMTDISPGAPWTKLARARIGDLSEEELAVFTASADLPAVVRRRAVEILGALREK